MAKNPQKKSKKTTSGKRAASKIKPAVMLETKQPSIGSEPASTISLIKKTWFDISIFWRPLFGLTVVYAVLYYIFVLSFTYQTTGIDTSVTQNSSLEKAVSAISDSVFHSYGGSQSDATALIQVILFLVATLALVWMLRRLHNLKAATIRDAFYEGPARIIPVTLVCLVLLLTLLPAIIGSGVLAFAVNDNPMMAEFLIALAVAIVFLALSLLLFVRYWPAFYIASLPDMRPIQALKSASKLTKKRRLSILRKFIMLGIVLFAALCVVVLPIALVIPVAVPVVMYLFLFVLFLFANVYLFELYRSIV